MGIVYQTTPYFYVKNLQGDVVAFTNRSGLMLVRYNYDAWGNTIAVTFSDGTPITAETHFGHINPIRYRGYYCDSETDLYYLNSRYYNPEWGRFINADGYANTGQGLTGTNMFAYCGNNPVNRSDSSGTSWNDVKNFFSDAWDAAIAWGKRTFGVDVRFSVSGNNPQKVSHTGSPIKVEIGSKKNINTHSANRKPVTLWGGIKTSDKNIQKSFGVDILQFSLSSSSSLFKKEFGGSLTLNNMIHTVDLDFNARTGMVGVEFSQLTFVEWDYGTHEIGEYWRMEIDAYQLVFAFAFANGHQFYGNPYCGYSNGLTPNPALY